MEATTSSDKSVSDEVPFHAVEFPSGGAALRGRFYVPAAATGPAGHSKSDKLVGIDWGVAFLTITLSPICNHFTLSSF